MMAKFSEYEKQVFGLKDNVDTPKTIEVIRLPGGWRTDPYPTETFTAIAIISPDGNDYRLMPEGAEVITLRWWCQQLGWRTKCSDASVMIHPERHEECGYRSND